MASKAKRVVNIFKDKKTGVQKSVEFQSGGAFGGRTRYLAPNVPMKSKKK